MQHFETRLELVRLMHYEKWQYMPNEFCLILHCQEKNFELILSEKSYLHVHHGGHHDRLFRLSRHPLKMRHPQPCYRRLSSTFAYFLRQTSVYQSATNAFFTVVVVKVDTVTSLDFLASLAPPVFVGAIAANC
uniref:Uncharacterized protein n=1 Tax=Romanomermis culicivorax TaxID=13658 RepID=A0A915JVK8_ROMCU